MEHGNLCSDPASEAELLEQCGENVSSSAEIRKKKKEKKREVLIIHLHKSETQIPAMLFGTLTSRYPALINALLTDTSRLSAMAVGGDGAPTTAVVGM